MRTGMDEPVVQVVSPADQEIIVRIIDDRNPVGSRYNITIDHNYRRSVELFKKEGHLKVGIVSYGVDHGPN